jgi:hypothetical protein
VSALVSQTRSVTGQKNGAPTPAVLVLHPNTGGAPEVRPGEGVKLFKVNGDILGNINVSFDPFNRSVVTTLKNEFIDSVSPLPREAVRVLARHVASGHYLHRKWALATLHQALRVGTPSDSPVAVHLTVRNEKGITEEVLPSYGVAVVRIGTPMLEELKRASDLLPPDLKQVVNDRMGDWEMPAPVPTRPELSI